MWERLIFFKGWRGERGRFWKRHETWNWELDGSHGSLRNLTLTQPPGNNAKCVRNASPPFNLLTVSCPCASPAFHPLSQMDTPSQPLTYPMASAPTPSH